jgi:hypothetical protein
MELEDDLEEQGCDPQTIQQKVAEFRKTLMGNEVSVFLVAQCSFFMFAIFEGCINGRSAHTKTLILASKCNFSMLLSLRY